MSRKSSGDISSAVLKPGQASQVGYWATWMLGWNQFWFEPKGAESLAIIRIACGLMLAYIHLIWLSMMDSFMGAHAWINPETVRQLHAQDWGWSWLHHVESPIWLYLHEGAALLASLSMALGLFTRLAIPAVWWLTLMTCNRMTGALFGLDQIVMMLSMYLMWSNCGSLWSLDARMAQRLGVSWLRPWSGPSSANTVVTRLIQLHLCVIYLFGGLSKMRGEMWWDGSAFWFSVVNYEYQSMNLTWLGHFPFVIGVLTAATLFWETFYCALIWHRLTRPVVLLMAVFVHGGICLALGMWTFGAIMIVANLAFIEPQTIRRASERLFFRLRVTN